MLLNVFEMIVIRFIAMTYCVHHAISASCGENPYYDGKISVPSDYFLLD